MHYEFFILLKENPQVVKGLRIFSLSYLYSFVKGYNFNFTVLKIILILFTFSMPPYLYGQYAPIVDTKSNWIYLRYENNDTPHIKSGYLLRIEQDTLIENTNYKKVYQYELEGSHPCPPTMMPCFELDTPYKAKEGKEGKNLLGFIRENLNDNTTHNR